MLRLDADCEIRRNLALILAVIDLGAVRSHSSVPISGHSRQLITTRLRVAGPTTTAADARGRLAAANQPSVQPPASSKQSSSALVVGIMLTQDAQCTSASRIQIIHRYMQCIVLTHGCSVHMAIVTS